MYRSLWFLAFALALVCGERAGSQVPTPPEGRKAAFTMRISLRERTIKPGTRVTLDLEIINVTEKEIGVASWSDPYTFDVFDSTGKSAPLTQRGRLVLKRERVVENGKIYMRASGSHWTIRIPAGGTVHDEVAITDFFALAQPGEYSIGLHRPDTETHQLVTSNTVTLTVASDSPPPKSPAK